MLTELRQPITRNWAWLIAALLAVTGAASLADFWWRTDLSIYDAALPGGPAPEDIVIVAADDASIAALGRWPWHRDLHAALLDRLRAAGTCAVVLDFLFTEPEADSPASDAALAAALARGPPTVLPMLVEMPRAGVPADTARGVRELLPIPALAAAAAAVGHANLELDRDGMVRSVFLREGRGGPHWLQIAAALLSVAPGATPLRLGGERHPDLAHAAPVWVRDYHWLIPFRGPPGTFAQLSYADVLAGRVPPAALRGKFVLVGATAQGIGDAYAMPRSGAGIAMSGVEINANVLEALRRHTEIRPLSPWPSAVIALIPVAFAGVGLLVLPPRRSLLLVASLGILTAGGAILALRALGWWWAPTASLATLLIMYPLWSWRRLEAAQRFLDEELTRLAAERFPLLTGPPLAGTPRRTLDGVERRIELLRQASARLRNVRRLFADTINGLPDATLLADATGRIVLANPAAATLFGYADCRLLEETPVDAHLHERAPRAELRFAALAERAPCAVEAELDRAGRTVLVRAAPFSDNAQVRAGTIIALADISELRAAQRERDDVLRFLSHDMKSPASSLLGLAQLQRDPRSALAPAELSARLDTLAQRLLALVDGFVSLARAESSDRRAFEDFDLRDAIQDAYDEVWATAQARAIAVTTRVPDEPVFVHGDRGLLGRAIVNLLGNALKFSAAGGAVELRLESQSAEAAVHVLDRGPGIAPEREGALFRRFSRGLHRGDADPGGAGLGLAFVRVVMEKHAGRAVGASRPESGAIFSLYLPAVPHGLPSTAQNALSGADPPRPSDP